MESVKIFAMLVSSHKDKSLDILCIVKFFYLFSFFILIELFVQIERSRIPSRQKLQKLNRAIF